MQTRLSIIGIAVSLAAAGLIGIAGSDGSVWIGDVPLFALCGVVAFVVHWIVFVPSYIRRTERYFDLTGSIAFVSVTACALLANPDRNGRALLLGALVIIWTLRLGPFLFFRVKRTGGDDRFDRLKSDLLAFLMTWTLSGLWVFITAAAALAAITSTKQVNLAWTDALGLIIWTTGFAFEVIADWQKSRFRSNPVNRDRFISHGLWRMSRHPNYFGEIMLWSGIAVFAFPALSGWQLATLISPVFVWLLLTRVSGIPLLEAKAAAKWGDDSSYRSYVSKTPILVPHLPKTPGEA